MMVRWSVVRAASVVGATICLMAATAWAQETRPAQETQPGVQQEQPPPQLEIPPPLPTSPLPTTLPSYPLELLGLLAPPPGATVLVPSIGIFEEYNDNFFLVEHGKTSDFKTELSPAIALFLNRRGYRIIAGYSFSSEFHTAENAGSSSWFGRQNFVLGSYFQVNPQFSLRLYDSFAWDNNTGTGGAQPFTVGRQESWVNSFAPGATWQFTPRLSLDVAGTYEARRFSGNGSGINSDSYLLQTTLAYSITSRFAGTLGYGFTYLNDHTGDDSTTHTPTVGFRYALTPSLNVSISGGPSITQIGGETSISPAGYATIMQTLRFGSIGASYTRGVSVAGGFGGNTDTQTASLTFAVSRLVRDLVIFVTPSYTKAKSLTGGQVDQVDVEAYAVSLGVGYRVSRYVGLFAGYDYLRQRTGSHATTQLDADQNRVKVGLQFGYPFSF